MPIFYTPDPCLTGFKGYKISTHQHNLYHLPMTIPYPLSPHVPSSQLNIHPPHLQIFPSSCFFYWNYLSMFFIHLFVHPPFWPFEALFKSFLCSSHRTKKIVVLRPWFQRKAGLSNTKSVSLFTHPAICSCSHPPTCSFQSVYYLSTIPPFRDWEPKRGGSSQNNNKRLKKANYKHSVAVLL